MSWSVKNMLTMQTDIRSFLPQGAQRYSQGTQRYEYNLANFAIKLRELCGKKWDMHLIVLQFLKVYGFATYLV